MNKKIDKHELLVLKNRVLELEEQIDLIHLFLKDAIKTRVEMDRGEERLNIESILP